MRQSLPQVFLLPGIWGEVKLDEASPRFSEQPGSSQHLEVSPRHSAARLLPQFPKLPRDELEQVSTSNEDCFEVHCG